MLRRLGYACLSTEYGNLSPRGVLLRNASTERLRELIKLHLTNLAALSRLNAARDIRLFRISSDVIPFASHPYQRRGVPKIHYSSQAESSRPGAHADYVLSAEFEAFLSLTRDTADFDCMLEAKAKDSALLDLRRDLHLSA